MTSFSLEKLKFLFESVVVDEDSQDIMCTKKINKLICTVFIPIYESHATIYLSSEENKNLFLELRIKHVLDIELTNKNIFFYYEDNKALVINLYIVPYISIKFKT